MINSWVTFSIDKRQYLELVFPNKAVSNNYVEWHGIRPYFLYLKRILPP